MKRLRIASGSTLKLPLGKRSILLRKIIGEFCPRFVRGGTLAYLGDAYERFTYADGKLLKSLGVPIRGQGKMADIVVYDAKRNWVVLIEAVTSHGPLSPRRKGELWRLFKRSKASLVYVTALLERESLSSYIEEISWGTTIWAADSPSHLIHFDGEKILGPYPE